MVQIKVEDCYDSSQLGAYMECPFSYYLQYVKGLRKSQIDDSMAAMNFGSAVHTFLEQFYTRRPVAKIDYEAPDDLPQFSQAALDLVQKTYIETYLSEDTDMEILETEKVSVVDIGKYKFLVKKDGAFKRNGSVFGLEHKTTSSISDTYFEKFYINSQLSAQYFTVLQDYGQCGGILLNVIEVKYLKRKPRSDKYNNFIEHGDGYLTVQLQRDYITREQTQSDDWFQNTLNWIKKIEDDKFTGLWCKSNGLWGGSACTRCQYKELCHASVGTELDEQLLESTYEEYNPYEYLEL